MIKLTPEQLIDILSAAIQFYKRIGNKEMIDRCSMHLKTLTRVKWDADAELTIDESPF